MEAFFSRHKKVALSFSAGKDSAACLHLLRPWWDRLTVVWGDPGDPHTETIEYMCEIAKLVPHFVRVPGNQISFMRACGIAVDAVPFEGTDIGRFATRVQAPKVALASYCCGENLWGPLHRYLRENAFTGVIRGQKDSDTLQGIQSGEVIEGVEYFYPVESWSDEDVFEFLGDMAPKSYSRGAKSSLDCRYCLAYGVENPGRLEYLQKYEPEAYALLKPVAVWLKQTLIKHADNLQV
jgi:phosphoadenosine phosphosulfate reductase